MPIETTAVLSFPSVADRHGVGGIQEVHLLENFRPVWRFPGPEWDQTPAVVAQLRRALAGGLAAVLAARGTLYGRTGLVLPDVPRTPLALDDEDCVHLYRMFSGTPITLWRFDSCCQDDTELAFAADHGLEIEVRNMSWFDLCGSGTWQ